MTTKTFIRLTIISLAFTTGALVFSAFRSRTQPVSASEDSTHCREKCDANCSKSDNTEIWESISRHLLGTTQ